MLDDVIKDLEEFRDRLLETDLSYRIFSKEMTALTAAIEYLEIQKDLIDVYECKIIAMEGYYAKKDNRD